MLNVEEEGAMTLEPVVGGAIVAAFHSYSPSSRMLFNLSGADAAGDIGGSVSAGEVGEWNGSGGI